MPGRPPTPIALHKARGTYVESRHGGKLEVPDVTLGDPPCWFGKTMREEWERVRALPHIKAAHRTTVEHHCVLYSRFVSDVKGRRPMSASERQTFHSIQMQLGLTPASQGKIAAPAAPSKDDPWAKLG